MKDTLPDTSAIQSARHWRRRVGGLLLLVALVTAFIAIEKTTDFEWRTIPQAMVQLPSWVVLPVTAILPLIGFPISIVYLVLGAKFGPFTGLATVAGITAIHILGTHGIARSFLREPLKRWLTRRHHRIPPVPPGEEASIVVVAVLAPVLPYFVRNYVLALSGIPLRTYFLIAVPLYTVRSAVTLFLGDLSADPSGRGFVLLGGIYVAKLAICAWLVWRLRAHSKQRQAFRNSREKPESVVI